MDAFSIGYGNIINVCILYLYYLQANDAYSAITQVDKQRAEPEKIRLWREENARRIAKKGKVLSKM